jgi:hypothetical protein
VRIVHARVDPGQKKSVRVLRQQSALACTIESEDLSWCVCVCMRVCVCVCVCVCECVCV